jgi:sugar phosphate isomerase/epimerase
MLRISAFADEISPSIDEQIRVCRANGVSDIELRGVSKQNVMDFDQALCDEIKTKVKAAGMGISAIGSPIGKVKITEPFEPHFEKFKKAVELAVFFEAPFIRLFSFYPNVNGENILPYRDEVIRRMKAMAEYVKDKPVVLAHENERDIYGEMANGCLDIVETVNSPKLRNCFDFANYVQAGQHPRHAWKMLKSYTTHIHIKDALFNDGSVVPAGKGDGYLAPILADAYAAGYRGFLTLEPHLAHAGQFHGFTGPDLFKVAMDALRSLCKEINVPLVG